MQHVGRKTVFTFLAILLFTIVVVAAERQDSAKSPSQRASELLSRMTLDEKISMLHGTRVEGVGYAGHVPANARLGIPALNLTDGPNGVGNGHSGITALPAAIAAAAAWDTALMGRYGTTLGKEQAEKGVNVVLAPMINIVRNPNAGRNFESLGEDPYLAAQMVTAEIKGIQSNNVAATVKHYAVNSFEQNRNRVNAVVSERALREIYLPAFEAAVKDARVGAVMCSYNKVNGAYACENPHLLNDILKKDWGFAGWVMSDWGATHSTVNAAKAGLDQEMPSGDFFGNALKEAGAAGQVNIAEIDYKVLRILTKMFELGLFDARGSEQATVTNPENQQVAREVAARGTVLLKNDQSVLPLEKGRIRSLAVIGNDAGADTKISGGGSASVIPSRVRTPLEGITDRAAKDSITVVYAQGTFGTGPFPVINSEWLVPASGSGHGLEGQYFSNRSLGGEPVVTRVDATPGGDWGAQQPAAGIPVGNWSARWSGTMTPPYTGTYRFSVSGGGTTRIFVNGQLVPTGRGQAGKVQLTSGQAVPFRVEYTSPEGNRAAGARIGLATPSTEMLDQAVAAAKRSDVAVVFVNDAATEGADRENLLLPGDQDQLVAAVAKANPRTVVVLNTSGAVLMPWLQSVASVVEAWYPGQESGDAIAAVLFGDVNPSGKLPVTFPAREDHQPASTTAQYPGADGAAAYSEGLLVGYRWYDAKHEEPLFRFGYGLSYATFSYSRLIVTLRTTNDRPVELSVFVTNTGKRAGAEVVQLYLGSPAAGEPPRQLKGFQKVTLKPGERKKVTFTLDSRALSTWEEVKNSWAVAKGTYRVMVGSLTGKFTLQ